MDSIQIKNLEVFAHHGVFPEENKLGQKFLINAALYTDTRRAGMYDDLKQSVHYGDVCQYITDFMQKQTYKLIETAAEQLAMGLLMEYTRLEKISLEILKPWAPIGLPVESVSVCIHRGWHTVYLSIGSNMGNREQYLQNAVDALAALAHTKVMRVSDWQETEPYGKTDQPAFLNGAVAIRTLLQPQELLNEIHRIEAENGRERLEHWGPRTLDIDILFFDHDLLDDETLCIPHPDLQNRAFVLEPLSQIAGGYRHPLLHKTVWQMRRELEEKGENLSYPKDCPHK